jgi:two-component sensor histidine kinase
VGLDLNQAVPCGLLINELVSNCLKHAFPDGRAGEVRVELQSVDGGPAVRLRVADNGVGLPADFDLQQLQSLGLQLVSDLVGQIQGRLEIGRGPGAVFDVVFTPRTAHPVGGAS